MEVEALHKLLVDCREVAKVEVHKLLKAGVIEEIDHPEWLVNPYE